MESCTKKALKIANVPAVLDPVAWAENIEKVADDLSIITNWQRLITAGLPSLVGINVASKGVNSAGVDNIDEDGSK